VSRSVGRVVDSLELVVDEVAVRSGHEDAMATGALYHPVVAHFCLVLVSDYDPFLFARNLAAVA
jgi:hypothetical protein